ncbi:MAG: type II toxin-antitoxin system RelE/ParE family toxin [Eggerthellaceae bacterium]|nr:type II toxin-antitoxin system RelE/ParE family toxin [Eggerthellaceae bacterium]
MGMFDVDYYEDENGKKPAEEFIDSLDVKMRAKVFGRLELLEEHGSELGMPFSRHLDDGVFELRTVVGNNITRILYFFVVGRRVILTHGFVKKTRKTPAREIDRAKKIREDWRRRNE